jgi:hypothetical protein
MKKITLITSRLKLQKEKITDLNKPAMNNNAGFTILGCTQPTTTVQPSYVCITR